MLDKRNRLIRSIIASLIAIGLSLNISAMSAHQVLPQTKQPPGPHEAINDRAQEGFSGPVQSVKTEIARLKSEGSKIIEGPRKLVEKIIFDKKGRKIKSHYYPIPGTTVTGEELYKYDSKGNLIEMLQVRLTGEAYKETYSYEFDPLGNWTKMITFVSTGSVPNESLQPIEISYRKIIYYLDGIEEVNTRLLAAKLPELRVIDNSKLAISNIPAMPLVQLEADKDKLQVIPDELLVEEPTAIVITPKPNLRISTISKVILNKQAVELPKPSYPILARTTRAIGTVIVEVIIDSSGHVLVAKAIEGTPIFYKAAEEAALKARFKPTIVGGQPVKLTGKIKYQFQP
jgi:TonB family protein